MKFKMTNKKRNKTKKRNMDFLLLSCFIEKFLSLPSISSFFPGYLNPLYPRLFRLLFCFFSSSTNSSFLCSTESLLESLSLLLSCYVSDGAMKKSGNGMGLGRLHDLADPRAPGEITLKTGRAPSPVMALTTVTTARTPPLNTTSRVE